MIKTRILLIVMLGLMGMAGYGQPAIQWQISLGGTENEYCNSICQTNDGGFIICGQALSHNGDVTGNHGNWDAWIVKLSNTGIIQWEKCYGGTDDDYSYSIIQTNDGGYIFGGLATSNNGDVVGNHGGDAWVVKLNDTGAIQWSRCYGGASGVSQANTIIQTIDDGYIFSGYTRAIDGDVTGNHGDNDGWVVRIDSVGNLIWRKCFGGSNGDGFYDMIKTIDGGYAMSGFISSHNGDGCTNDSTHADYWVVKIDSGGLLQWSKCYGGNGTENAYSLIQTLDGGFLVGGSTATVNNGDVLCGNHGWFVLWVLKLNSNGNEQWAKCYADTVANGGFLCPANDSGFVIIGNASYWGCWVVKADVAGTIQWTGRYGSNNGSEDVQRVIHCSDGGYAIACSSSGTNHDITNHHGTLGSFDYWIVKLAPDSTTGIKETKKESSILLSPNPFSTFTTLTIEGSYHSPTLFIYNLMGQEVQSIPIGSNKQITIPRNNLPAGMYFYKVIEDNKEVLGVGKMVVGE